MTHARLKWYNLRRRWKNFNRNPPSNTLQVWSQVASIVFGAWAIALTIWISRQNTAIKDMDKLLKEQVAQTETLSKIVLSQNQQVSTLTGIADQSVKQVEKLQKLQDQSGKQIEKLQKLQELFFAQNTTIRINTAPNVILSGRFTISKLNDSAFSYSCGYTNSGSRVAKNAHATIYAYVLGENGYAVAETPGHLSAPVDLSNKDHVAASIIIEHPKSLNRSNVEPIYYKMRIDYEDELTGKKMRPAIFYYRHYVDDELRITETKFCSKEEISAIQKLDTTH